MPEMRLNQVIRLHLFHFFLSLSLRFITWPACCYDSFLLINTCVYVQGHISSHGEPPLRVPHTALIPPRRHRVELAEGATALMTIASILCIVVPLGMLSHLKRRRRTKGKWMSFYRVWFVVVTVIYRFITTGGSVWGEICL